MSLDNSFLSKILNDAQILQGEISNNKGFSVDSRTIKQDEIFVALNGSNFDGHDFISQALENGACGLIISKDKKSSLDKVDKKLLKNKFILVLDDVLSSLLKLVKAWRKEFEIPVVGITGSVGKTSTKEILSNILSLSGKKYFVSKGNQNTVVGLILNFLQLKKDCEVAIFELGIGKRGEMEQLVSIVKPTLAIVTALGHSHMSGLGSINEIAIEKRQIFKYLKENNIGVINGDQPLLASVGYKHPVVKFGSKTTNQIQARKIKVDSNGLSFVLKLYNKKYNIQIPVYSESYAYNCLGAASLATLMGISNDIIVKSIQKPVYVKGRFEFKTMIKNWGVLIDDCYNASPESVKSAILAFENVQCEGKKIFVFSDMFELGQESAFWHRQIGRFLQKAPSVNKVILVGSEVKWTAKTLPVNLDMELVSNWQDAIKSLELELVDNSKVLVKGSTNGYKTGLVNLVNYFAEKKSSQDIPLFAAKALKDDLILGRKVKNI